MYHASLCLQGACRNLTTLCRPLPLLNFFLILFALILRRSAEVNLEVHLLMLLSRMTATLLFLDRGISQPLSLNFLGAYVHTHTHTLKFVPQTDAWVPSSGLSFPASAAMYCGICTVQFWYTGAHPFFLVRLIQLRKDRGRLPQHFTYMVFCISGLAKKCHRALKRPPRHA